MLSTSESLLIRLKSAEDDDAWARFVRLYSPLIYHWARRTGVQTADARDLVQDVLTTVFRKLPVWQYDPRGSFRGWLRTITLNRHRELIRRKSHQQQPVEPDHLAERLAATAQSTWDLNYARELVQSAMELMRDDFAPETWGALKRIVQSGESTADVARETGVSPWTLYSARNRLMTRLRRELDGLLD